LLPAIGPPPSRLPICTSSGGQCRLGIEEWPQICRGNV
jgi:hypothetical protein